MNNYFNNDWYKAGVVLAVFLIAVAIFYHLVIFSPSQQKDNLIQQQQSSQIQKQQLQQTIDAQKQQAHDQLVAEYRAECVKASDDNSNAWAQALNDSKKNIYTDQQAQEVVNQLYAIYHDKTGEAFIEKCIQNKLAQNGN